MPSFAEELLEIDGSATKGTVRVIRGEELSVRDIPRGIIQYSVFSIQYSVFSFQFSVLDGRQLNACTD